MEKLNLNNIQCVGVIGEKVCIARMIQELPRGDALVHAAWIVATAERAQGEFAEILIEVRKKART
jgi:hypothetical protein